MRKKLLSIFISTLFLINLFFPVSAFAAAPSQVDPDSLRATASCDGEISKVKFEWDYDSVWDNRPDQTANHYVIDWDFEPGAEIDVTSPITKRVDEETEGTWKIWKDNCYGGFPTCNDDVGLKSTGTYSTEKCSQGEEPPPTLNECIVSVSNVGSGTTSQNPGLIKLEIDTQEKINSNTNSPYYSERYNVFINNRKVKGVKADGSGDDNKVEFHNWDNKTTIYSGQVNLISSGGVLTIPSLDANRHITNKPNGQWDDTNYEILVQRHNQSDSPRTDHLVCSGSFAIGSNEKCVADTDCFSGDCNKSSGKCNPGVTKLACNFVNVTENEDGEITDTDYICQTAIGPFSADVEGFSKSVLRIILGLAGGILLLLIIINGYKLMTSQGDPEKLKEARDGIIAAIVGILLIIFSLSILQLIVVDVIGIPGFSR